MSIVRRNCIYRTHSAFDPKTEAAKWAAHHTAEVVIVFGYDPIYLDALSGKVVCWSPDGRGRGDPRVTCDWLDLKQRFPTRQKRIGVTAIPVYKTLYPYRYLDFLHKIAKEKSIHQLDSITSLRFAYEWQRNLLRNLPYCLKSTPVKKLFGQWEDKPYIVCGTGPSLDDSLDDLRKAQGKACIVAIGSALGKLLREGIEPTFAIAFDGGLANYKCHFEGLKTDVPLIWDPILNWKIVSSYTGPLVLMNIWPSNMLKHVMGQAPGYVRIGPSVSNTALTLGVAMGANPIILYGQDLAFKNGITHASGTNQLNSALAPTTKQTIEVPAIGGGKVTTSLTIHAFLVCFEQAIAELRGNPKVINASKYGAHIEGAEHGTVELFGDQDALELRELITGGEWDREHIIQSLEETYYHATSLKQSIQRGEEIDWPAISRNEFSLLHFSLNVAWDGHERGMEEEWVRDEALKTLNYSLPLLRQSIKQCIHSG